jgi:hypothetical protein
MSKSSRLLRRPDNKTPPSPDDAGHSRFFVSEILMGDPGLDTLLQSTSGYSPRSCTWLSPTPTVLTAHTDALKVGQNLPPVEDFNQLLAANPLEQLRIVYGQARICKSACRCSTLQEALWNCSCCHEHCLSGERPGQVLYQEFTSGCGCPCLSDCLGCTVLSLPPKSLDLYLRWG